MAVCCSGSSGSKTEDTAVASDEVQPVCLNLQRVHGDSSPMKLYIYPDSLVFEKDGGMYVYDIDKDKSFENLDTESYVWIFAINRREASCPDYTSVSVFKHMDDLYGYKGESDAGRVFIEESGIAEAYDYKGKVDLEQELFANHPESKPYPELIFDNLSFKPFSDTDMDKVPLLIKNAKRVVIKDYCVTVSDGRDSVDFPMIPLSDYEVVYSEGYEWYFKTAAVVDDSSDEEPISLRVKIFCGFDFEDQVNDPRSRGLTLYFEDWGYYEVGWDGGIFNSWNNLRRKISVRHPNDKEFQDIREEGILPDNGE